MIVAPDILKVTEPRIAVDLRATDEVVDWRASRHPIKVIGLRHLVAVRVRRKRVRSATAMADHRAALL